ncbi:MAG: acyl-ACP--UDP-N-acetylglucosamine O-acyltransferase [Planctomyces sp.]|nr:acyl-ACP--UDP-N-acetylglucosamine O-acyltransferase [Planctomyces sp.]
MAIHATAVIDSRAEVHPSCNIGPYVVIDGSVRIGPDCSLGPSVIVVGNTELGPGCFIHAHVVIGDVPQDRKFLGFSSSCRVGEGCVIREGVTIHRASIEGQATVVGDRCYLMTNSHVAHDCVLENEVTLVSGALLGGHVHIGRKAIISGNVGIHQFVRIGELAMIGGVAMISQDVPPFTMTDHQGTVVGLNSVGLVRDGVSSADRDEIKTLFRIIYRSGMPYRRAVQLASELAVTNSGKRFAEFFRAESRRGVCRSRDRGTSSAIPEQPGME